MKKLFAFLTIGLLLFAVACGGDDDDDSAPAASGSGDAAPAATATTEDESDAEGGETADSSSSGESVGSVTIGEETWNIVADVQCSMETVENNLPVISIAGHAEGDESVEITIDFDPRDTGLRLAVTGEGGDPSWMANQDMVVSAGAVSISGEGTFTGGGETVDGSFEAMC